MQRQPMPPRRTSLARGAALVTKRQMRRTATPRAARQQPQDGTKGTDWTQDTREAMQRRNGGHCERCGQQPGTDPHHRKRRREGDHRVINGAWLCRPCHRHVHEHPAEARDHGFIVSAWSDPATAPLLVNGNRWVVLRPDGSYRTDQRGWPA